MRITSRPARKSSRPIPSAPIAFVSLATALPKKSPRSMPPASAWPPGRRPPQRQASRRCLGRRFRRSIGVRLEPSEKPASMKPAPPSPSRSAPSPAPAQTCSSSRPCLPSMKPAKPSSRARNGSRTSRPCHGHRRRRKQLPRWFVSRASRALLTEWGAGAIGVNCSTGPATVLTALEAMRKATNLPLAAMPNAGMPRAVEGRNIYLCSPNTWPASLARPSPPVPRSWAAAAEPRRITFAPCARPCAPSMRKAASKAPVQRPF